ncbi:bleomycin hydrolase [Atheta coriaria]|uniref:bleomycin hydrolase n=1 Tax=Dalotia coriaria TaxID=877792 RepID=UPI0031F34637
METLKPVVKALDKDVIAKMRTIFASDKKNIFAQNVCSRVDPFDVCLSRKYLEEPLHVFNHKVDEVKPTTNQKSSGRCWIFAVLNAMRVPFMKKLTVEEFEFSQGYLFFWDKIERSNFFLNNVAEVTKRGESIDGRLMSFLLNDPTSDGGQWDMLVNLITKYGVMPKKNFPETFSCEQSMRLNSILKSKHREYAKAIRDKISSGASDADVKMLIEDQMLNIFRVVGICLGVPSEKFTWEYYDKNKAYHSVGPITPREFYETHIKPVFNIEDKVCLVTDPRPTNPFGNVYTVDCLGNMVGGRRCIYNNQPAELLLELTAKSIKDGEPVWFGCEVSKRFAGKLGILDLDVHDFPLVFNLDIQKTMTKADRLLYGDSSMTHAMVFTAVQTNGQGEVTKLRVENSWGEDRGEKGYIVMSVPWFHEFVFEVVVDKKYVPASVMDVFKQEPIVLPAWDPMGTLA